MYTISGAAISVLGLIMLAGNSPQASASPLTYHYHQNTATVPGLVVFAQLTVDGDITHISSSSTNDSPISFGNLLDFQFSSNGLFESISLRDFTATCEIPFLLVVVSRGFRSGPFARNVS